MPWLWDIWITHAKPTEQVSIPPKKGQQLGKLIAAAMQTLPPLFCGPVRDPFLKRQSQYKAYEWMAILHWYMLPIGLELEINYSVLQHFSLFVYAVEFAMTVGKRSDEELWELSGVIHDFLLQFERLYVGSDPEKISRCRLCIFQLIHVPAHIKWYGSIRLGSQAPVERAIGEMGHKIHSKKEPFSNLTNIITELEVIRNLQLYYPDALDVSSGLQSTTSGADIPLVHTSQKLRRPPSFHVHLEAIQKLFAWDDRALSLYEVECFGKLRLLNGNTLRSQINEAKSPTARCYRWFEVRSEQSCFRRGSGVLQSSELRGFKDCGGFSATCGSRANFQDSHSREMAP
jgi:hypothetical protein